MSRIGKTPVTLPDKVVAKETKGIVNIKGPLGELSFEIPKGIRVEVIDKEVVVHCQSTDRKMRALWGMTRAIIANNVKGISQGYKKTLNINGVGYKAEAKTINNAQYLMFSLGYSHPIYLEVPKGVTLEIEGREGRIVHVSGIDNQVVGQVAATIRSFRPPEPYKGKGIKYSDEIVRRKAGKAGS